MGYSRRVRFGDLRSGLPRLDFATELVARLAPARRVEAPAPTSAERGEGWPAGRHARRPQL